MKIELRNVSKSYGRVHALDDVTLDIEPGQIISLLGRTLDRPVFDLTGANMAQQHRSFSLQLETPKC